MIHPMHEMTDPTPTTNTSWWDNFVSVLDQMPEGTELVVSREAVELRDHGSLQKHLEGPRAAHPMAANPDIAPPLHRTDRHRIYPFFEESIQR